MARLGQGIMPQLGAVNYSPILQGSLAAAEGQMRGAEAVARGIASLGQQAAAGIEKYYDRKESNELFNSTTDRVQKILKDNPAFAKRFGVTDINDTKAIQAGILAMGGGDKRTASKVTEQLLFQLGAEEERSKLERDRLAIEQARLAEQLAKSRQEEKNQEALVEAFSASQGRVPQTVTQQAVRPSMINAGVAPRAQGESFVGTDIYNQMFPLIAAEQERARAMRAGAEAAPVASQIKDSTKGAVRDFLGSWDYLGAPAGLVVYGGQQPAKVDISKGVSVEAQPGQQKPITEFVSDAAVAGDKFSKIISGNKFAMDVLKKNPEFANMVSQTISQQTMREMTKPEQRDAFINAYIDAGGKLSMDFLKESKKMFGGEITVMDVGGLGKALFLDGEFKAFAGFPKEKETKKTREESYNEMLSEIDRLERSGRFDQETANRARKYAEQKFFTGRPVAGADAGFAQFFGGMTGQQPQTGGSVTIEELRKRLSNAPTR